MAWRIFSSSWPLLTLTVTPGWPASKSLTTWLMASASRPVKKCQNVAVPEALTLGAGAGAREDPLWGGGHAAERMVRAAKPAPAGGCAVVSSRMNLPGDGGGGRAGNCGTLGYGRAEDQVSGLFERGDGGPG